MTHVLYLTSGCVGVGSFVRALLIVAGVVAAEEDKNGDGMKTVYVDDDGPRISSEDMLRMIKKGGGADCCIMANGSVSLHYSQSGWFWVEALYPDSKPYSFQWQIPADMGF